MMCKFCHIKPNKVSLIGRVRTIFTTDSLQPLTNMTWLIKYSFAAYIMHLWHMKYIWGNIFCCNSPSSHIILFEVRGSITSLGFFCRSEQTELGNNPRETFPRKPSRTSEAWWWPFKGLRGFPDKLLLTEDFTDCVTLSSSFVHFIHFSSKFIHLHRLSAILIPFLHFHPL